MAVQTLSTTDDFRLMSVWGANIRIGFLLGVKT